VCFNLSNYEYLPPQYFDGVLLPYTDSFKYMGMVCDKQINLNTVWLTQHFAHSQQARSESIRHMSMIQSSKHAAGPLMASAFRVPQFVRENSLVNRPYISL